MGRDRTIFVLVVVLVAACAFTGWAWLTTRADDDPELPPEWQEFAEATEGARPCTDVFAPGRPTADVLVEYDTRACTDPTGELMMAFVVDWGCYQLVEGYGWGQDGQGWQGPEVPAPAC